MSDYTVTLDRLGESAGALLAGLGARLAAGEITEEEFLALVSAAVLTSRSKATGLADTALAAALSVARGSAVPALGLLPPADATEVLAAVRAALSGAREQLPDVLHVEGRADALATAQDAYSEGMRRRAVPAWQRVPNADACPLCVKFALDVLPGSVPMFHHKGCTCTQRPLLEET